MPKLDLTGQASEDEPASSTTFSQHQNNNSKQERNNQLSQSRQQQATQQNNSPSTNDDDQSANNHTRGLGILTQHLPSPIDLWQKRTPVSLVMLPIVFVLYVLLQLPLHYNSTTEKQEWKGRAKDVTKLSNELNTVEKKLDTVKDDQAEIKGMVTSLRRRLGKMKERRIRREEMLMRREERERQEQLQMEQEEHDRQQRGVAKERPITSVSVVGALGVATFAGGKSNNEVDDAKKDD